MNTVTVCTCGTCPTTRRERGLPCFADRAAFKPQPSPIRYSTAEACSEAFPGFAVVRVRGGMGHGFPSWIPTRKLVTL